MDHPSFTIALPVRDGGQHLPLCVASILSQNCGNFELAILDNASRDGTTEWLATLRDPRVRLYPADRPLSIEENWARIKDIPKQEFMTMIGHDDLLDPNFLEVVSRLIQVHPDAGLYLTHFRLIDTAGVQMRRCLPMPARETAAEFLAARLCRVRDSYGTGYVLRSRDYDALGGIPNYPKLLYADDALFLQAAGFSYRATALEEAFSYRLHAASTSNACAARDTFQAFERYRDLLTTLQTNDPALRETLTRYFADYAASVGLALLTEERLAAYRQRRTLTPETEQAVRALTTTFGGEPAPGIFASLPTRLLEKALDSRFYRVLYGLMAFQLQSRGHVHRLLQSALRQKQRPGDKP